MKVIVVGGGAAGFFTAINVAQKKPKCRVVILEKSNKLLSKVKVSGGGRCNITNSRSKPSELVQFYPRGFKKLNGLFKSFNTEDMIHWLAKRNVHTKIEDDLRVFPSTDSSQTIIDCFISESKKYNIEIKLNSQMKELFHLNGKWCIKTNKETFTSDIAVIASGSSINVWDQLKKVGLDLIPPVPSLFTFNIKDNRLKDLQGITIKNANAKIAGHKLNESGPLLITHWGLSGPSILKLSAWGAQLLNQLNYKFEVLINYVNMSAEEARSHLIRYKEQHPKQKAVNYPLFQLPKRLWERLISHCGISEVHSFAELSKKHLNKLIEELTQGRYQVDGKSTFKEEFVTCGGVKLNEVNLNSFECKRYPNLYLAGEVLDIDALTGGFNFQACWSAGWQISEHISSQKPK